MRRPFDPARIAPSERSTFRRHTRAYVLGAAVLAGFHFSMNRIDWLSRSAVDRIFGAAPATAWQPAAAMLLLAVVAFVTRVMSRWFFFNAGRDVEYELRAVLLQRLHRLGAAFYRTLSSGEIMSRATGDLAQVRMLYGFGVMNFFNVGLAFTSALQVMLKLSPKLTLAALAPLPLLTLVTRTFSRGLFTRMRANQDALGRLSEAVQANIAGVRVIRSFALEAREERRFERSNHEYLEASLALARLRGSMVPILGSTSAAGMLVVFWYGASLLLSGEISQGDFFAFALALARMTWPMIGLGLSLAVVQRGRAAMLRLQVIFEAQPEITDGPDAAPASISGALRVEQLSFAYGEHRVLDGVSFTLAPGRSLAVVGRTGAGKSTLAMLLARLLPTPPGTVFLDGHDVCRLPLASVRGTVGYAQQDPFLFSTTVSRNIGLVLDDPDGAAQGGAIRDAAREAQVLEEALGLPEQLDTVVGERGVQLSGGQKQRIALARALVSQPTVLILDDPLSAVDARTEAAILGAIEREAARRSVVLITHRVAAAARCNSILVLDGGRVIEAGTHEALVRAGGLYAAFAEEQQMAEELDAIAARREASG
jgi:ATP-binding cassette subfamily B protein